MSIASRALICGLAGLCTAGCGASSAKPAPSPAAATSSATPTPAAPARTRAAVRIHGFAFHPRVLRVVVGARVTWRDGDAANHTVTFRRGPGDLGNVDPGKRVSARFDRPGTYAYVCRYHPNMHGRVIVRPR